MRQRVRLLPLAAAAAVTVLLAGWLLALFGALAIERHSLYNTERRGSARRGRVETKHI